MNNVTQNFEIRNCSGCGACVNACPTKAISYSTDAYGFIIPLIDESKCISCGKCINVCPFQNVIDGAEPQKAYAAVCNDSNVLMNSSSGGVFYTLAKYIIEKKGCVFGASMNEKFEIEHICVENIEDLSKLQKSKYVQSFIGNAYSIAKNKLKDGRLVLFSGTPCQIAAMKACVKGLDTTNLYLVEIVCHGVPNQQLFNSYLDNLQSEKSRLKKYTFRYKRKLQNGMNDFLQYQIGNKSRVKNWVEDSFHFFFMSAAIDRECCFSCKYAKKERVADITLCDYWHWGNYHEKDFKSCSTVSGVIINSSKGFSILDQIKTSLLLVQTEFNNIARHNGCLLKPTSSPKNRQFVLDLWKKSGYAAVESWYKRKYRFRRIKSKLTMLFPEKIKLYIHKLRMQIIEVFHGH